jgi:selenocysteine lyase/cysteine desulfurase
LHGIPAVTSYLSPPSSWDAIIAHEHLLQTTLLNYLASRPDDVTVYGDVTGSSASRVSTVSFRVRGWASRDVVGAVEGATNFGFRSGGFYSERLARELLGLDEDGVVRVSMVHYNTGEFQFF